MVDDSLWQMDRLFMEKGEYVRIFDSEDQLDLVNDTTVDQVVVERIFFSIDSVRQYHFLRNEGRWQLKSIDQLSIDRLPNASFLRFYRSFTTDSAFQQKSLCDEIAFTGPDPDDDFARLEGFITPDSWGAFAPELPQDSLYNIVYGKQDGRSKQKFFIICGVASGMETGLCFEQRRGKWKLSRLTE